MARLAHRLTNDMLFKMMFVKYPGLLKRLIAEFLGIDYESIEDFHLTNPEITPEEIGKKFCRLDINMTVNGQIVDLEVQVLSKKSDNTCYPSSYVIRADFEKSAVAMA